MRAENEKPGAVGTANRVGFTHRTTGQHGNAAAVQTSMDADEWDGLPEGDTLARICPKCGAFADWPDCAACGFDFQADAGPDIDGTSGQAGADCAADQARQYIAHGFALVPIPKGTKGPNTKGWNQRERCWNKAGDVPDPTGNVGLAHAYSNTAALDVDSYTAAGPALTARGVDLDALLTADDAVQIRSGRPDRAKLLYRLPAGVEPLPSVDRTDAGEGFEFRCGTAAGLTVQDVLPPSIHPDTGKPYQWAGDWRQLPELPESVLIAWRALLGPQRTGSAKEGPTTAVNEGRHADVLKLAARIACMVIRDGIADDAGLAMLHAEQARGRWNRDVTDELHRAYADALAKYRAGVWQIDRPAPADGFTKTAPEPLRRPVPEPAPYPMESLGPILADAAIAIRRVIQAPDAICGASVLAAASLASQGLADAHHHGRVYPLSLWLLSIAESGERKSAVDAEVMRAAREFEKDLGREYQDALETHRAKMAEWEFKQECAKAAAKAAAKKNQGVGLADALLDIGPAPEPPLVPKITVADFTAEGIAKLLIAGRPTIGAFTDEAALVFGGHGMTKETVARTAGTLCKLWDVGTLDRVRAGDGATKLHGRRMALHLMAQPVIAEAALGDALLSGQGFLPRCLLAWPTSTAGSRPYVDESMRDDPALIALARRLGDLHRLPLPVSPDDEQELAPHALTLTAAAAEMWRTLHDAVEKQMAPGARYATCKAWASKTPEQCMRIAGVLTVVESPDTTMIEASVIERAAEIALYHLNEAVRLAGTAVLPAEVRNAEALLNWCHETGRTELHSREAQRLGPSRIRDRETFNAAMKELAEAGWASKIDGGKILDGAHRLHVWKIKPASEGV